MQNSADLIIFCRMKLDCFDVIPFITVPEPLFNGIIGYGEDFAALTSHVCQGHIAHVLCLKGYMLFDYCGAPRTLKHDSMTVLSYLDRLTVSTASDDFSCLCIVAPAEYLRGLLPLNNYGIFGGVSLLTDPIMPMLPDEVMQMQNDMQSIRERLQQTSHRFFSEMIGCQLKNMIYDIFDIHARLHGDIEATDRVGIITQRFLTMIQEGTASVHRNPRYYAAQLNISVKYLSDTIKRVTGESVSSHINRAAVAALKTYLDTTSLNLTQIADTMRFNSLSYFTRYCKRHLGVSPKTYRRLALTKNASNYSD